MQITNKRIFLALLVAVVAAVTLCAAVFNMRKSVRRRLLLGDVILVNRQPFLYKQVSPFTIC